jgi:D-arabinose 1-dehydrogenase-like Zn-dependent alcohol dehydrogenase
MLLFVRIIILLVIVITLAYHGHSQKTITYYVQNKRVQVISGVRSMNEVFPLESASEAYELMMSGKARFRAVLTTG